MMRVLIVKMSSLGDIVHAFPILPYIKNLYPNAQIDWVVEQPFADLVHAHPFVHRTLVVQTKKWRKHYFKKATWQEIKHFIHDMRCTSYDLLLDLQGNLKSGVVTFFAHSKLKVGFGYPSVPEWPNILFTHKRYHPPKRKNIRDDYLFIAQNALGDFTHANNMATTLKLTDQESLHIQPLLDHCRAQKRFNVMVCPGSNWPNKQLSKETLQLFLSDLSKQMNAYFLFLWGNQAEKMLVKELATQFVENSIVIEKVSLPSLQNLMGQVDLVVAMDSLPLHLAATTATPTFSIFGASLAAKYMPLGNQHHAFQGICPYGKSFEKRCDVLRTCKTGACIKDVDGKQLFAYFNTWWSSLP